MDMSQKVLPPAVRRVLIKATDGAELVGLLYRPAVQPRAVIVLNGAMGVPQGFYKYFAEWAVAMRGVAVLTYDYRDSGLSRRVSFRASKADLADWGISDQLAARRAAQREVPDVPVWIVGHSLGGLTLPLQNDFDGVTRIVAVASGLVHVSDHPGLFQWGARFFWHVAGPALTKVLGFLPGKYLGVGANMPADVFWQWRRWCTTWGFYAADPAAKVPAPDWPKGQPPTRVISVSDDLMIPPVSVARLAALFTLANVTELQFSPADRGLGKIGHMGVFLRRNRALWSDVLPIEW